MAQKYKSKWTGPQIDEAVGNVSKKIDKDSLIGSDGITINKTDSTIEISGTELVKKTTEANKVYGTDSTGGQALKPFANTPTPSALAAYNDVSNLKTSVPVEDLDCTNKKYVDDNFVKKVTTATQDSRVYGLWPNGEQAVFKLSQNIPEIHNIAQYTTGDNIRTNTPIDNLDCANKKYVDDAVSSVSSLAAPITFETVEQLDNYVKTSASAKKGQIASVLNTTEQRAYLIIAVGE